MSRSSSGSSSGSSSDSNSSTESLDQPAKPVQDQIRKWIKFPFPTNQWFSDEKCKIYLRKARRIVEGKRVDALDVGTVEVFPEYRRKGVFSQLLDSLHRMNPWDVTFVENVLNKDLEQYLTRTGWVRDPAYRDDVSFYKYT